MSRRAAGLIAAAGIGVLVALLPVRTRAGLDYQATERTLPLWRKATDFVIRHRRTSALSQEMFGGAPDDSSRALAVFQWTRRHIRDQPAVATLVDDHIWSIIERGYGANDQKADVFATLLTYAGTPAYWVLIGPTGDLPIALVRVDGRWRVFDVENGIVFRDTAGNLATPEQLVADPSLVTASAAGHVADTAVYRGYFEAFSPPAPPRALRAELQMPLKRFTYELRTLMER